MKLLDSRDKLSTCLSNGVLMKSITPLSPKAPHSMSMTTCWAASEAADWPPSQCETRSARSMKQALEPVPRIIAMPVRWSMRAPATSVPVVSLSRATTLTLWAPAEDKKTRKISYAKIKWRDLASTGCRPSLLSYSPPTFQYCSTNSAYSLVYLWVVAPIWVSYGVLTTAFFHMTTIEFFGTYKMRYNRSVKMRKIGKNLFILKTLFAEQNHVEVP